MNVVSPNIINPNPTIQSHSSGKLRSTRQADSHIIRLDKTSSNQQVEQPSRQNETIRVIRVASDGLKIAEFGAKSASISNGQSSFKAKPEQQYLANQQLLEREEIGPLLGIDIFA